MAGSKVAGAWKAGDPPPVQGDYTNAGEYDADDSKYRRWKQDQARDSSGAIVGPANQPTGPAGAGYEWYQDAQGRWLRRKIVTGSGTGEQAGDDASTGQLGDAARAEEERRRKKAGTKETKFRNFRSAMTRMG